MFSAKKKETRFEDENFLIVKVEFERGGSLK